MKQLNIKSNTFNEEVELKGYLFEANDPKAIVILVHGMAEHKERYFDFANFLMNNNYTVYSYDQRGHGETCGAIENQGYMSDIDNFMAMVNDVLLVNENLKQIYPNNKFYILGHSMGSFVTQRYIELYPDTIDGAILSGSNYTKSLLYKLGELIAKSEVKKHGRKYQSKKLDNLSFGSYNNKFKPNRTNFDWLSVNEDNVNKYIDDPYCGYLFTASYFMDFIHGLNTIAKEYKKVPKSLPLMMFAGSADPVGGEKGVTKLFNNYVKNGSNDVEIQIYEGKRHEVLNETNKEEVYTDVLNWLDEHND